MKKEIVNVPASVHTRIHNLAKLNGAGFQEYFYYYTLERFLYRLSKSLYADKFVLKGGLMFTCWGISPRRPTRDIDVQGYIGNSLENIISIVKKICEVEVDPDGMVFDSNSLRGEQINDDADYQGMRVYRNGYLGQAIIQFHLDVSFANAITPHEIRFTYPSMLQGEDFEILGYTVETTIAEKFHAMIVLGRVNGRLKDFFDIWLLSEQMDFSGRDLLAAFQATFNSRHTPLPVGIPIDLSDEFGEQKRNEWQREIAKLPINWNIYPSFPDVIIRLRGFILPIVQAAINHSEFEYTWKAGRNWQPSS